MVGKRGPSKQPTELKLLNGTFRKDRDKVGPVPANKMPECPIWLPVEAKEKWDELAPKLQKLGLLTEIDGDEFARYCLFMVRSIDAEGEVEKGLLVDGAVPGTRVKNPAVQIARDYAAMASKIADKFGMNPSSRNGLDVDKEQKDDAFERLLDKR